MLEHLKALKDIRNAAGLTQLQLANKLGVSQPNVARLEGSWETSSIQQASDWLDACSVRLPKLDEFVARLRDASVRPEVRFAIDMETVLRSQGEFAELHRKPLVVVLADDADSAALQATCVRSLMAVGGIYGHKIAAGGTSRDDVVKAADEAAKAAGHFDGFYLPSEGATVIWKHISARPRGISSTVATMNGMLQPWMLGDPIGGIQRQRPANAPDRANQKDRFGNFSEASSVPEDWTVVVYWDHPLLQRCDLVQIPPPSLAWQSYANGSIAAFADLRIICAKNASRLSAVSILTLLASSCAPDFVVLEDNRSFEQIQSYVEAQFGLRPVGLPLNMEAGLKQSSGLLELAGKVLSLDAAAQDTTNRQLIEPELEQPVRTRGSPRQGSFSARLNDTRTAAIARLLCGNVDVAEWTPDFERVWQLAYVLGMPRHDPTSSRLDIDSYVLQVSRAIEPARMPSIQDYRQHPLEFHRPTSPRFRALANQLWLGLRGNGSSSEIPVAG